MTMPSRVSAERSLWAQIAAIASLRVSMNFTAQILRLPAHFGCTNTVTAKTPRSPSIIRIYGWVFSLALLAFWRLNHLSFPSQRFNGIESRGFPCRPQAEDDPHAISNTNADRDGP